jgi:chaperonin GroEL
MSHEYDNGSSLREKTLRGVNVLADNVASTLGPRGRNVVIHQKGKNPFVTKDGVTVAKFVELEDPFENAAAQIIKQASSQTNQVAGDGTTTATVIARSILENSQKYLAAGVSSIELKRGIDKAVKQLANKLEEQAKPIRSREDIAHIATISANNDKTIGELIATAVDKVGKDGAITVEEARSVETALDVLEGFRFDSGYLATAFVTDDRRGAMRYENSYVLVTDYSIESVEEILPTLELVARENKPLVIVAENVEGQALAALIMNSMRGTMKVAAVKAPRYGEERRGILDDLALSVGATFISRESGMQLRDIKLENLGVAKTVESLKNMTTIVGGKGDFEAIDNRIESLKEVILQTDSMHECEKIQERITRLASGIAVVYVGGLTEVEMVERKHRIEDALEAVKAAQEEGVVPGGGVALVRAAKGLSVEVDNSDQELGVKIVLESVREPLKQMAQNAGKSADLLLDLVESQKEGTNGYNFVSDEVVDMFEAGIIDPVKVTKSALRNAASAASVLITTDYAIIEQ